MISSETTNRNIKNKLYLYGVILPSNSISIDDNEYVSIRGNVSLNSATRLNKGVLPFKFGIVTGNFVFPSNSLKSFYGFPKVIRGHLYINSNNHFESLKGFPKTATKGIFFDGSFTINDSNVKILESCKTEKLILSPELQLQYNRYITINKILK